MKNLNFRPGGRGTHWCCGHKHFQVNLGWLEVGQEGFKEHLTTLLDTLGDEEGLGLLDKTSRGSLEGYLHEDIAEIRSRTESDEFK